MKRKFFSRYLFKCLTHCGLLIVLITVPACSPHKDGPVPVPRLPLVGHNTLSLQNVTLAAELYADARAASQVFGFDIRAAGLLPVRCLIDNRGRTPLIIHPQQSFLIDRQNLAWPLLTGEQARNRIATAALADSARHTALTRLWGETPGASGGGLAFGLHREGIQQATGGFLGRMNSKRALSLDTRLSSARPRGPFYSIESGSQAEAYLLFPGRQEAQDAVNLRLGLEIEGYARSVNVPVSVR